MVRFGGGLLTALMFVLAAASAASAQDRTSLPCGGDGAVKAANRLYCVLGRNHVTPAAQDAIKDIAAAFRVAHPGAVLLYMDASKRRDEPPLWPHRSHGDGRQLDLALFYETRDGQPLDRPPALLGYGAYEPPLDGERQPCAETARPADFGDPPSDRNWRMDSERTGDLVTAILSHPRVRRIFIEPHLADRLGVAGHAKVGFAGCAASRHDDHIHIDFAE